MVCFRTVEKYTLYGHVRRRLDKSDNRRQIKYHGTRGDPHDINKKKSIKYTTPTGNHNCPSYNTR